MIGLFFGETLFPKLILKNIKNNDLVILLDEKGKEFSTKDFSKFISDKWGNPDNVSLSFKLGWSCDWPTDNFTYGFTKYLSLPKCIDWPYLPWTTVSPSCG